MNTHPASQLFWPPLPSPLSWAGAGEGREWEEGLLDFFQRWRRVVLVFLENEKVNLSLKEKKSLLFLVY